MARAHAAGVALALAVVLAAGSAPAADKLKDRISKEKKELSSIKRKITEQKQKQQQAAKRETSVLTELESADRQLASNKTAMARVNKKIRDRDAEIARIEPRAATLRGEIEEKRDQVAARVRTMYQRSRLVQVPAVFAAGDANAFVRQQYALAWVSRHDTEVIETYRRNVAELEASEARLRAARAELLQDKVELAERLGDVQRERQRKARLLARVRDEKAVYERTARELEQAAGRVTALLGKLESQSRPRAGKAPAASQFARIRGRLDWPSDGQVVANFGRQKHPKFDTFIYRKGIDIQSSQGRPIQAVYDGRVAFADWFKGYGLLVILDHGENYYSLYAHAAKLLVAVGDAVRTGQVIGEVGDTGLTGESNLYFELRQGSEALDPMLWLRRR